jgi:hypothetical protein
LYACGQVSLSEGLAARMRLRQVDEYQLGWVDGVVCSAPPGSEVPIELRHHAADDATADRVHGGIFIGAHATLMYGHDYSRMRCFEVESCLRVSCGGAP